MIHDGTREYGAQGPTVQSGERVCPLHEYARRRASREVEPRARQDDPDAVASLCAQLPGGGREAGEAGAGEAEGDQGVRVRSEPERPSEAAEQPRC